MATERLYIYHTNDLHARFRFWPRIHTELLKRRAQHEKAGEQVLVFDIGDAADRAHPLIEATMGQAIPQLFNAAKYDAVTIGNNEGVTYAKEALNRLYEGANFSVLLANLVEPKTGASPAWAKPYEIIQTKQGIRIGIFGLTEPIYDAYEYLGWTVKDPFKATEQLLNMHQDKADFWIVLSHLGIDEDQQLAKRFPLDLILGAHTHHALPQGQQVAGTWLAGAGNLGQYLGEICLVHQGSELTVEHVGLIDTAQDLPPVSGEVEKVQAYLTKGHDLLSKQILATTSKTYERAVFENSSLMQLILEAITDFTGTEAAFLNAGLLMGNLQAGPVTADDLHRILPHPIRVMKCEVQGKNLSEIVKRLVKVDAQLQAKEISGNGFRGKEFGKICFKGITVKDNKVYWLEEPVKPEATYSFATVNYLSFFSAFDFLNTHTKQTICSPELLREVVGQYLITQKR